MRISMKDSLVRMILAMGLLGIGSASALASRVVLDAGTVVPITLDQNLSSDHSVKGDTFTATVKRGYMGLPDGTRIEGVVRNAVAKRGDKPGVLVLDFTRIVATGGRGEAIDGTPVGLDSKSVTTGKNGRIVAKAGTQSKRLTYVGYGAGAGALIALLGGGKGIIQDTAIGAGLGYLAGALEKGGQKNPNNVLLKKGSSMGVLLHDTVTTRF